MSDDDGGDYVDSVSLYESLATTKTKTADEKIAAIIDDDLVEEEEEKKKTRKRPRDEEEDDEDEDPSGGGGHVQKKPCRRLEAGDFSQEISIRFEDYPGFSGDDHGGGDHLGGPSGGGGGRDLGDEDKENEDPGGQSSSSDDSFDEDRLSLTGDSLPSTSSLSPSISDVSGLSGHDGFQTSSLDGASECEVIYYVESPSEEEELTPTVARVPSFSAASDGHATPRRRPGPVGAAGGARRGSARRHLNFLPAAAEEEEDSHLVPSMWDAED